MKLFNEVIKNNWKMIVFYVLKDGEIVERGHYDELLQKDGYFTKLYKAKK